MLLKGETPETIAYVTMYDGNGKRLLLDTADCAGRVSNKASAVSGVVIERRTAVNAETVVLRGLVRADGTLEVLGKVGLTPGPVEVTVRTVAATATPRGNWWEALAKIRAVQAARGHAPRTREEINALRDE